MKKLCIVSLMFFSQISFAETHIPVTGALFLNTGDEQVTKAFLAELLKAKHQPNKAKSKKESRPATDKELGKIAKKIQQAENDQPKVADQDSKKSSEALTGSEAFINRGLRTGN
jgi:hypothetical protein